MSAAPKAASMKPPNSAEPLAAAMAPRIPPVRHTKPAMPR